LNYSISEKECLALVWAVGKFKAYILGCRIRVLTDHHSLCWLLKKKDLAGHLARWSLQLQDLDFEIVHRSGEIHHDADALSRQPVEPPKEEQNIPMLLLLTSPLTEIAQAQKPSNWWGSIRLGLLEKDPSRQTRKLIRNFELRNGVLFHCYVRDGKSYSQLCVPRSLTNEILLNCHEAMTAGHLGMKRTLDKVVRLQH
jgi:hypothetical protein